MSTQVHPLFRDVHVVHSLCNALCSVFGVDFYPWLSRNKMGHVVWDDDWHRVPMYLVKNASTVYYHCLSLSSTCKRARALITAAFREHSSFYFIFHLNERQCQPSIYSYVTDMVTSDIEWGLKEALRYAKGAKKIGLGTQVDDYDRGTVATVSVFVRTRSYKDVISEVKLFDCDFPRYNDLYESQRGCEEITQFVKYLCARRDLCIQRLISACYSNSKRALDKRASNLVAGVSKRLKITHNQ